MRIFKAYGEQAIDKVRENPYRLALDIHGIRFKIADTLAQKLSIAPDSLIRAQAGVRHVLQEWSNDGHCAAIRDTLCEMAVKLLEIPAPIIDEAVTAELAKDNLIAEMIDQQEAIFLAPLYRSEVGCSPLICFGC